MFWAIAIGLLTIAMLMANGITALQSATVIMGLPFSFVMLLVMAGLYKSLRLEDYRKASRSLNAAPVVGNVDILNWKQRLSRVMHHPGIHETLRMLDNVCSPAVQTVADELIKRGMNVEVNQGESEYHDKLYHLDLTIFIEDEHNFVYQIWPVRYIAPTFSERGKRGKQYYYRLETFLYEGSQDNDLVGYTKEQVINDILDKYERHMTFLHINRISPGNRPLYPDSQD